ncbi:MAG TPA: hypothetical protein VGF30_00675 [Bacteroidia bacterium]
MKKFLVICCLFLAAFSAKAQFISGIGIFGSGTSSRHEYVNSNERDTILFLPQIPESHRSTERLSWGAGVVFELFSFRGFRLQSELEYINKGALEKNELVNAYTNERQRGTNKYKYIGFNNFAKFRLETFNFTSSLLIGARIEYMLGKSTPAYSSVSSNFKKLWISPDVGVGFEPYSFGKFKIFTELHYNPDVRRQYNKDKVVASNRTWELRVGLMYRKKKMNDLDCNAPRYHDPY